MYKIFFKSIIITLGLSIISHQLSVTGTAQAEGISLSISPALIRINLEENESAETNITLENKGSKSITLKPNLRLFKPSNNANGSIIHLPVKDNKSDVFDKVELSDASGNIDDITIGPKQQKRIKIKISTSDRENSQDYYFSVIFLSTPREQIPAISQSSYITLQSGVATNILLSIKQNNSLSGEIEEFSAPFFTEKGPVGFNVKIKNNSSHLINPTGTIKIKNMFGQTIGNIDIPTENILSEGSRYLATNSSIDKPQVTWNEKFLFGFYNAELSIKLSEKGPTLYKSISFFALPVRTLLLDIAVIFIAVIIYQRVKKRMRD